MFGRPTSEGWHEKPFLLASAHLAKQRLLLRHGALHDTNPPAIPSTEDPGLPDPPADLNVRTADGSYNDLDDPGMGMVGMRFGRNVPLDDAHPDLDRLMVPNPREVSLKLMTRGEETVRAGTINVLAAAWIQFQTHGWFAHENDDVLEWEVPAVDGDDWRERRGAMRVKRTAADPSRAEDGGAPPTGKSRPAPPTAKNRVTHWWDGSQIYGSSAAEAEALRTGEGGKMKIGDDGLLPLDPDKEADIAGFNENWWTGLSVLHHLFVKEHNYVCDHLAQRHPEFDDTKLYHVARLIIAAMLAKIHTVEWTVALLDHPATINGLQHSWWGLFGQTGIVGGKSDHDDVPFTLTEEFVSVYRMHPLMLDEYSMRSHEDDHKLATKNLFEVSGKRTRDTVNDVGMTNLIYSMGTEPPGLLVLHNYPKFLQELQRDNGEVLDLAAVDVLRDRERGVPRYNDFRVAIGRSRVETFADITADETWQAELEEVYGDVDSVDLMAGMFAEPFPKGFGFSETAFRLFNLMAPRRLRSDRFYTNSYSPKVYTEWGFEHVEETTMIDILRRHYPGVGAALEGVENAFKPWNTVG